ncbi:MAG: urea transporter [Candidatus Cloacimonetes bacterium]|nr:urea transporter [Candidatus Cloacimonadota bacterium]
MKVHNKLTAFGNAILNCYSTILFSNEKYVGLLILLSTMLEPKTGLTGLFGAIIAIFFARIFRFDSWESISGIMGFNSLLVSLGFGYFYPFEHFNPVIFLPLLIITSVLTLLTYVTLNSIIMRYFNFPSMSLAFSFIAIFLSFFYLRLGGTLMGETRALILQINPVLPRYPELYFKSLGSIFFQPNIIAGVLISIALLLTTRIGFVLSILGYSLSYLFMTVFNNFPSGEILFPSLNLILITIAIGGVFFIPSWSSYLLAVIAAITGLIIAFSFQTMLYNFYIPPFAFPYCITVFIFVYSMRLRLLNSSPYGVDFDSFHPEGNLEYYYSRIERFYQTGTSQFFLPFSGEWTLTQGNDGEHTHKQQWRFAWDFEVYDKEGKAYKNDGIVPNDYYCYGKPALASASGYVVKVLDGIPDNPINQINTTDNWGNYVIIQHWGSICTMYAHLKSGSITVRQGDYIVKGTRLGAVGNSGRAAVPHLHFNVQLGPEAGSSTLKAYLVNYKKSSDSSTFNFIPYGIPEKGETISPLLPEAVLQDILHLKVSDDSTFRVNCHDGIKEEKWEVAVDLLGNLSLSNNLGAMLYFSVYEGIYNGFSYTGKRKCALYAFAVLLSRFPYLKSKEILWHDKPPLSIFFEPYKEKSILFLKAFMPRLISSHSEHKAVDTPDEIIIRSQTTLFFLNKSVKEFEGEVIINKKTGVQKIEMNLNGTRLMEVERII